ncbi:MAG: hypothetical protein FWC73_09450, partial [Defluviitaleaceae bacterium]|nr:hypothetical protein [Defluviitaleaceae bacterium]
PPLSTLIFHQATALNMPFSLVYHDIPNATFHLVVTDPAPGGYAGRTITTVPIPFAVGFPTDPYNLHRINITRPVTVRAADGANIYLRMPFYGSHAINTAPGAPWEVTVNNAFNRDLGRHFVVPTGISFTLGGTGTGNLTLDGNVSAQSAQPTARRGGIRVYGGALTMSTGSRITNSRNVSFWSINQDIPGSGGAVQAVNGANFTMTGNAIIENSEANTLSHFHAGPNPPGNLYTRGRTAHGGGVYVNDSTFNMSGDAIIRNNRIITSREGTSTAHSPLAILSISGEGGGVHITNDSNFTMSGSAEISGNIINTPTTTGFYAVASTVLLGGGGVAVWHGSTFTMSDNAVIRNNEANSTIGNRDGGGVVVRHQDSIFNMISGYIQDNTGENGGGVAMSGFGVTVDGVSTNYPSGIFTMTNGTIRNNTALASGGGVYVFSSLPFSNSPPSTFLMYAGIIGSNADDDEGNTAINGGGVHVAGGALFEMRVGTDVNNDPTSGTISGNSATGTAGTWPNINGGGGVHVVGTNSNFNMYAGTIGNNDAVFGGGGVLVLDNANFNLRETANKTITRNTATWGGGVWVAWVYDNASADTSHMTMEAGANNLHITHNTVTQRGGGIFTMAAEYADPLTRVSGTNIAFTNLALYRVNFSNNRAGHREVSPSNALDVMPDTVWSSLSTDTHPINNYDINFIGRGFELPLAGGTGTLMFIILGTMLLTVASAFILYKKYQVKSYDGFTKNGKVYSFKKLY